MRLMVRICAVTLAMASVAAVPAGAQTDEPSDPATNVAVGDVGTYDGQTQTGVQGRTPGNPDQGGGSGGGDFTVQAEFASCSGQTSQYILRTYSRAGGGGFAAGYSSMRCGTQRTDGTGWGLRHIEARHRADWQAKANYVGATWEDFLDFSVAQTLAGPSSVTYRSSNDTYLYKAPIQIRSSSGALIHQFTSNVVVAAVSKNIITAFPTT